MDMQVWAGTSGFAYKEWKGVFYPRDLPASRMLSYYSAILPAVEINNTFYRMPAPATLEGWAGMTPPSFRFILKAPRKITHIKPLAEKAAEAGYFLQTAAGLEDKLGAILFQLPPYLHKNTGLLSAFLELLPPQLPAAFEFRHSSWFDDQVYSLLRAKQCALCCSDTDDQNWAELIASTDWGYVRLRRPDYTESDLRKWYNRIVSQPWKHAYVFFKHEDAGAGPELARRFLEMRDEATGKSTERGPSASR
jgi:uncharacterized protein YecE (DUF72 family)